MEIVEYKLPLGSIRYVRMVDGSLCPLELYREILWYRLVYAKNILLKIKYEGLENRPSRFLERTSV